MPTRYQLAPYSMRVGFHLPPTITSKAVSYTHLLDFERQFFQLLLLRRKLLLLLHQDIILFF